MRRLRGFAVLALLAALMLSGCQTAPDQALSVGDVSLTNAEIDAAASEFEAARVASAAPGTPPISNDDRAFLRQYLVQATIFNEVARRFAEEQSIPAPNPNFADAANRLGLAEDHLFVRTVATNEAYQELLLGRVPAAQPTEADLRDAYDRYVKAATAAGVEPVDFETIKQELQATPQYGAGIGLRNALAEAVDRYGVTVSPRYQPLELPVWAAPNSQLVLVALEVGDQADAVRDLD